MDDMTTTQPNDRATNQGGGASDTATAVAGAAPSTSGGVATGAGDKAADVRDTVADQAGQVAQDAKAHASRLLDSSKEELRSQSEAQATRVAEGLHSLSSQLRSLANGTAEPGPLVDVTRDAGQRIDALAERLDARGIQGLMGDVGSFARRRPGTFLLGALATGFVAGRVVRAAQPVMSDTSGDRDAGRVATSPATTYTETPMVAPGAVGDVPPMPPTGYLEPSVTGATGGAGIGQGR